MKALIKRAKTNSLAALLLFLATVSMHQSMVGLRHTVWEVEQCVLASKLIKSKKPDTGDVDRFEDEFADGMQDHWDDFPSEGFLVDLIRNWDDSNYNFGGFFRLSSGEVVRFERLGDYRSEDRQKEIERWTKKDEALGGIGRKVVYQPYDIDSPTFPDTRHDIILADGSVRWGNFDYYTKDGWGMVQTAPEGIVEANLLDSKAVRLAEPWVGTGATPEGAYFHLRTALAQHKTKIPIVGWEVASDIASSFIAVLASYIAVVFVHTIYGLRDRVLDPEEPWLAVATFDARNRFEAVLKTAVTAIGVITFVLAVLLPLATAWLVRTSVNPFLFYPVLAVIALTTIVSAIQIIRMVIGGNFTPTIA